VTPSSLFVRVWLAAVLVDELEQGFGQLSTGGALAEFTGDIFCHISLPALGGIERHDSDRIGILPLEQMPDERRPICGLVRLAPCAAEPISEIVQHKIDFPVRIVRHD